MFRNETKEQAASLRQKGRSLEEIATKLKVSKPTLSVWLKDIVLTVEAKERLLERQRRGRKKVSQILRNRRLDRISSAKDSARSVIAAIPLTSIEQDKLMCALIYYCEGAKSDQRVAFTNSDPELLRAFLDLLRRTFKIDESRLRSHLHLHSYHDEKVQKDFWSKALKIPEKNFIKIYRKREGGLFKKEGYPGCVTVRYHDAAIARELLEIARQYFRVKRTN